MGYDARGNVTHFFDAGAPGADDDIEAAIDYHEDLPAHIVGKPSRIVATSRSKKLRHREATYEEATGNLLEVRRFSADGSASASTPRTTVPGAW